MNPPPSKARRFIPAAVATLVFATCGVLVLLTVIPPSPTAPSAAADRQEPARPFETGRPSGGPRARTPFTTPPQEMEETTEGLTSAPDTAVTSSDPDTSTLAGSVTDRDGGPVAGALIKLARADAGGPRSATSRTDASGEFVVKSLTSGTWRLSAAADGYRPQTVSVDLPRPSRLELVLEDDPGLRVSLVDVAGAPVGGARVAVRARSNFLPGRRSGVTNADGTITLSGILATGPDWRGQLTVKHDGHVPLTEVLNTDDLERGEVRLVLQKSAELRLRIVSADGAPVAGALVTALPREATGTRRLRSVSSGEVHFRGLSPGTYTVSVTTNRDGQALLEGITVGAGKDPEVVREIPLVRGDGSLTVRVIDHEGQALPRCTVRLIPSEGINEATTADTSGVYPAGMTDELGRCRFEALTSADYDVEVGGGRFTRGSRKRVSADGREVVLSADLPGVISGRVELPQVTGAYSIRVTGSPASEDADETFERTAVFSATRRAFTLSHVPRGLYTLDLLVDGRTIATIEDVEVRPGETTAGVTFGSGEAEE